MMTGTSPVYPADDHASRPDSAELARMRDAAKHRRRRLIYNNDGNDMSSRVHADPESFLSDRTVPALNTQVDSIFYCTGVTTLYDHDTNVAERSDGLYEAMKAADEDDLIRVPDTIKGRPNPYVFDFKTVPARVANMRMLRAAGTDSLALVTKRAHEAGLEVFWSHRINDIHDSFCGPLLSMWKRLHPECLMGTPDDLQRYDVGDPQYWWSTLDFEKPEVLDYLFRITEEVCRRYDVDGIEIDYFRHPVFFRPNLEYKPATPAQVDILTAFQRRIREMTLRESNRRGRPILLAAHVPMSREACLHVGIDIERWLKDDLVDLLVVGSGYQPLSMPSRDFVELGHAHDVPVYPNISGSGFEQWQARIEAWRGAASNIWRAGADGIHVFNRFPSKPGDAVFTTAGDPDTLAGLDKVFGIDNTKEFFGCLEQAVVQSQILPVKLDPSGKPRTVNLPVGDGLAVAAAAGRLQTATLRVQFAPAVSAGAVELSLNGGIIAPKDGASKEGWVAYRPAPGQYRTGDNALSFRVTARDLKEGKELTVRSVELQVDYR